MNMRVLEPSRSRVTVGDLFTFQMKDGRFYFGRVVSTTATVFEQDADPKCNLIYVFGISSDDERPPPGLTREALLIPPLITNNLPWRRGYFKTITRIPLSAADVFPRHCFRDLNKPACFRDERGQRTAEPRPGDSVSNLGLDSFRTVDDAVSKALGIELSKE